MSALNQNNWNQTTLGEVLTFQRGFDITKQQQQPGQYWVISSSGPQSTHAEFKVQGPGLVIGRKGTLGSVFFSEGPYWPHDTTLWVKDFHGNDVKFAYYFLQTLHLEQYDAGASNPTLNRNHIHLLPVRYPPLPTQRRIASILSAYDDLIENNTRRIKLLEQMAQAIYREWFVEFRAPGVRLRQATPEEQKVTGKDRFPVGWQIGRLGDIAQNTRETTEAGTHLDDLPYVPIDLIPRQSLALVEARPGQEAKSSLLLFKKSDILFGAMRAYFHKIVIAPFDGVTRATCFVLRPTNEITYGYTALTLFAESTVDYANTHSRGSTMPYAVWNGVLENMPVVIPTNTITLSFDELVKPMLDRIAMSFFQQRNLRQTRDLLLPRLVGGELNIVPEDTGGYQG